MRNPSDLLIAEVFGPTFQGEGPSIGRLAFFVRLAGCNLRCVWCDTPYTWDWKRYAKHEEATEYPIRAILSEAIAETSTLVVITGGEPLLQSDGVRTLALLLTGNGLDVEIETSGTRPLLDRIDGVTYNVSPKLSSSGNGERAIDTEALTAFAARDDVRFKFVLGGERDATELMRLVHLTRMKPTRVWLMPEARTAAELANRSREVAEFALEKGFNFSTRLHVALWGDRRGV